MEVCLEKLCVAICQFSGYLSKAYFFHETLQFTIQHLRQLENRLDKARLKSQEAEHISKVYEKIKAHLQQVQTCGIISLT